MKTFRQSGKLVLYYVLREEVIILAGVVVFVTHRKKLEEVEFVDEEFLHK